MFKKLAKMISEIKTENDRDATFWQIDREFEQEKISAQTTSCFISWPEWSKSRRAKKLLSRSR